MDIHRAISPIRAFGVFSLLIVFGPFTSVAAAPQLSQAEWADLFEARESVVWSGHALFEMTFSPADASQIEAIKQVTAARGEPDAWSGYVYREDATRKLSYVAEWWRSGEMERTDKRASLRWEEFERGVDHPASTTAFDGHIVRRLDSTGDQPLGSVNSMEDAYWKNAVRHDRLFGFSLEFLGKPYSHVVRSARDFSVEVIQRDGRELQKLRFLHDERDDIILELYLDENQRLVESQYWRPDHTGSFYPRERWVFSEYREVPIPGGETFSFPGRAMFHLRMGQTADGVPVEYARKELVFRELEFNLDIPTSVFEISFPPGTKVYDELSGAGWLVNRDELGEYLTSQLSDLEQDVMAQEAFERPVATQAETKPRGDAASSAVRGKTGSAARPPRANGLYRAIATMLVLLALGTVAGLIRRHRRWREKNTPQ
jgi:hypothetical protein